MEGQEELTTQQARLVVVGTASTNNDALPALEHVESEIQMITRIASVQSHVSLTTFRFNLANVSEVENSLRSTHMVHIASHGMGDATDPFSGGLYLKDGILTISTMMKLNAGRDAFFAFLSACGSARSDSTQLDQSIHFTAAMLFAGFRSVAATLW
jgi:CHAT domain-containing protein